MIYIHYAARSGGWDQRDQLTDQLTSRCHVVFAPPPPPPAPPLSVLCPGRQGELFRYLRFSYKGGTGCGPSFNTYLQVAEVQVFAGTYNLAQDKPTSALDIWGNSLLPKYMTDGKTATFYHSSTVSSATFSQIDMMVRSAPGHGADTHTAMTACPASVTHVAWTLERPSICKRCDCVM